MGKHERGDIELLEKSVVRVLMGQTPLLNPINKWFGHMLGFVNFIKKCFPGYKKVKHIGNKYDGLLGDIKIYQKSGNVEYLELKASETPTGKGTLANISQNALTEYCLILAAKGEEILNWSDFRKRNGFEEMVKFFINEFDYPRKFSFDEKARFLRKKANEKNKEAIGIKKLITNLAKMDKKEYINYIRRFRINEDHLKKFIFCMLNGIHIKKDVQGFMAKTKIVDLKRSYTLVTTLYANIKNGKIIISREQNKVGVLLDHYDNFRFSFPLESEDKIYTYICCYKKTHLKEETKILGLTYLWKNIFQGIKTPCINVFLGPDYKSI